MHTRYLIPSLLLHAVCVGVGAWLVLPSAAHERPRVGHVAVEPSAASPDAVPPPAAPPPEPDVPESNPSDAPDPEPMPIVEPQAQYERFLPREWQPSVEAAPPVRREFSKDAFLTSLAVPPAPEPAPEPTQVNAPTETPPSVAAESSPFVAAQALDERNAPPVYPPRAVRLGIAGTVVVELAIAVDGTVTDLQIATSSGHVLLDRAAAVALRAWHFAPARRDGAAVADRLRIPVTFRIEDGSVRVDEVRIRS